LVSGVGSTGRRGRGAGDKWFYRDWGQSIRALTAQEAPGGNRYVQVSADRAEYLLGDRVSLHARLLDSFYRPIKVRQVSGTIKGESGAPVAVTFTALPGSPGLYAADFLADRMGKFDVELGSP